MKLTLGALVLLGFATPASSSDRPIPVELWRRGDDALTLRFAEELKDAYRSSPDFAMETYQTDGLLVVYIENHVGWRRRLWRTRVSYDVGFYAEDGRKIGLSRGACWKGSLSKCANQVLRDSKSMAAILLREAEQGPEADQASNNACPLDSAQDGDRIVIRAELSPGGHDLLLCPAECPDARVVLIYGDRSSQEEDRRSMRRDEAFRDFERYAYEEWPDRPGVTCIGCMKYRVTADFEGVLEVAPSAGWHRDPDTGAVVGIEGFGPPRPFTRYRLVMTGVSRVETAERERQ